MKRPAIRATLSKVVVTLGARPEPAAPVLFPLQYFGDPLFCKASVVGGVLILDISDKHSTDDLTPGTAANSVAWAVTYQGSTTALQAINKPYDGSDLYFGVQVSYPDMSDAQLIIEPMALRAARDDHDTMLGYVAVQNNRAPNWYDLAFVRPKYVVQEFARLTDASVVEPREAAIFAERVEAEELIAERLLADDGYSEVIEATPLVAGGPGIAGPMGPALP